MSVISFMWTVFSLYLSRHCDQHVFGIVFVSSLIGCMHQVFEKSDTCLKS
jgi:hypothetical protein